MTLMTEDTPSGVEAVAPGVRRLTAPNPSPMTYTGTQSYLVGPPEGPLAVIDPGPESPAHLEALMAAAGGAPIALILVTHSHRDHSAGVPALRAATGAEVLAFGPHGAGMSARMAALKAAGVDLGGGEGADPGFKPDRLLVDGERVALGALSVEVVRTPGHLSNHLAFLIQEPGVVFTGDAVMGWSSTLVSPPEGDMAAQMQTLHRLAGLCEARPGLRFLPGHGPAVEAPGELIAAQIAHRLARRASILGALEEGPAAARDLAARLYTDTPAALLPAATRNVFATLLQLEAEGEAAADGVPGADTPFMRNA